MHRRKPVPDGYVPPFAALRVEIGSPGPFDPFSAQDVIRFCQGIRSRGRIAMPATSPQSVAVDLSAVAVQFIARRRELPGPTAGDKVKRLEAIAKAAGGLLDLVDGDLADLFDPDIGHAPAVREAMGVSPDLLRQVGVPYDEAASEEAKRQQRLAWSEVTGAAKDARELLEYAPEPRLFLQVLRAAALHQAGVTKQHKRRGPEKDSTRHDFVLGVLRIYQDITGIEAKSWFDGIRASRGGPPARFLMSVCACLAERLADEEREADPQLPKILRAASEEAGAGQWVNEAVEYRRELRRLR